MIFAICKAADPLLSLCSKSGSTDSDSHGHCLPRLGQRQREARFLYYILFNVSATRLQNLRRGARRIAVLCFLVWNDGNEECDEATWCYALCVYKGSESNSTATFVLSIPYLR